MADAVPAQSQAPGSKRRHNLPQTAPPTRAHMFKCLSLWETFLMQTTHLGSVPSPSNKTTCEQNHRTVGCVFLLQNISPEASQASRKLQNKINTRQSPQLSHLSLEELKPGTCSHGPFGSPSLVVASWPVTCGARLFTNHICFRCVF